jgi:hypothetical protein
MSGDCKKTTTVTVTHYARRKGRIITFKSREAQSEFYAYSAEHRARMHDLHHAFVFVASCDNLYAAIYAVCYGQRAWSPKEMHALYDKWTESGEDWRVFANFLQRRATYFFKNST